MVNNTIALRKQAEGVSQEYLRLQKEGAKPKEEKKEEKPKNKGDIPEEERLKNMVEKVSANYEESIRKLEAENKSLKNKLEDFSLVFGDLQKKKV